MISSDGIEACRRYQAELSLPFPVLSDEERRAIRDYAAWNREEDVAVPALYVVDSAGAVRLKMLGQPAPITRHLALMDALTRMKNERQNERKTNNG